MARMDDATARSVWIGWGSSVVFVGLAILTGGILWAYVCVFAGIAIALRGHFPRWFTNRTEEQIIAGIPSREALSIKSWLITAIAVVLLAIGASSLHRRVFPDKPDLAKTILDGVKKIVAEQQHASASEHPTSPASPAAPVPEANPPSPIPERAAMRIEEPRLTVPSIQPGALVSVSSYCRNITSTSVAAKEVFCGSQFEFVLTFNGEVITKDQEIGYQMFERNIRPKLPKKGEGPTIYPPEAQYGITTVTLSERDVSILKPGGGTIMVFTLALFKDDLGSHRTEGCFWLSTRLDQEPRVWSTCTVHSGIKY